MRAKRLLSLLITILIMNSVIGFSASAEDVKQAEVQEIVQVSNPQFMTFDENQNEVSKQGTRNSRNSNFDSIKVSLVDNYAVLEWAKTGTMKVKLYESAYPLTDGDTFIGILEEAENMNFEIVNFRIETNANSLALTESNLSYENQPVLYLGIWDKSNEKIYYLQEKITDTLPEDLTETVSSLSTDLSCDYLEEKEMSYLGLNIHEIPDFTVDSSSFEETLTTVTTDSNTTVVDDRGAISAYAADVVPGVPNSAYAITALNQWQNVFYGWSNEHGYALYAQLYAGTKNRIIYTLPYMMRRTKSPGTGDRSHQVYFKLNRNSLVSYDPYYGTLSAKEGTAAKCETSMYARAYNEKGVITSRQQSAVISESRLKKALKVIIYSISKYNIGTGIETLTTLNNSDNTDEWNIWASNYKNQLLNGDVKKAYKFIQNNLKTKEDRTWLGIKTNEATNFDIGCVLRFYF